MKWQSFVLLLVCGCSAATAVDEPQLEVMDNEAAVVSLQSVSSDQIGGADRSQPVRAARNERGSIPDRLNIEQLFGAKTIEELDRPTEQNLTEVYKRQYPQGTAETLNQFVKEQPIITKLPAIDYPIVAAEADSATALDVYLDNVSHLPHRMVNSTLLAHIQNDLFEGRDGSSAYGQAHAVRSFQDSLRDVPVPPAARDVHRLLLGYSELLVLTFTQMARYPFDPAQGLVAIRQLDEAQTTYEPLIKRELARIDSLYRQKRAGGDKPQPGILEAQRLIGSKSR